MRSPHCNSHDFSVLQPLELNPCSGQHRTCPAKRAFLQPQGLYQGCITARSTQFNAPQVVHPADQAWLRMSQMALHRWLPVTGWSMTASPLWDQARQQLTMTAAEGKSGAVHAHKPCAHNCWPTDACRAPTSATTSLEQSSAPGDKGGAMLRTGRCQYRLGLMPGPRVHPQQGVHGAICSLQPVSVRNLPAARFCMAGGISSCPLPACQGHEQLCGAEQLLGAATWPVQQELHCLLALEDWL